jgi:hypothetical protein
MPTHANRRGIALIAHNDRRSVVLACSGSTAIEESWDKFGTKIVSMRFILVHIGSLTIGLQPE